MGEEGPVRAVGEGEVPELQPGGGAQRGLPGAAGLQGLPEGCLAVTEQRPARPEGQQMSRQPLKGQHDAPQELADRQDIAHGHLALYHKAHGEDDDAHKTQRADGPGQGVHGVKLLLAGGLPLLQLPGGFGVARGPDGGEAVEPDEQKPPDALLGLRHVGLAGGETGRLGGVRLLLEGLGQVQRQQGEHHHHDGQLPPGADDGRDGEGEAPEGPVEAQETAAVLVSHRLRLRGQLGEVGGGVLLQKAAGPLAEEEGEVPHPQGPYVPGQDALAAGAGEVVDHKVQDRQDQSPGGGPDKRGQVLGQPRVQDRLEHQGGGHRGPHGQRREDEIEDHARFAELFENLIHGSYPFCKIWMRAVCGTVQLQNRGL